MHYQFPLTAISGGSKTILINNIAEFHAFAKGRVIGYNFTMLSRVWDARARCYVDRDVTDTWIIRDDCGRVVLADAFGRAPQIDWRNHPKYRWCQFDYRDGPVPGICRGRRRKQVGNRKRHGGRGVAARIRFLHSGDPRLEIE